jgi:hypothetical protein
MMRSVYELHGGGVHSSRSSPANRVPQVGEHLCLHSDYLFPSDMRLQFSGGRMQECGKWDAGSNVAHPLTRFPAQSYDCGRLNDLDLTDQESLTFILIARHRRHVADGIARLESHQCVGEKALLRVNAGVFKVG